MNKILIIGTGAWATALANTLLNNKQYVKMYGISQGQIDDLKTGCNKTFFKELKLDFIPQEVSNKIEEVVEDVDFIIICVPSKNIESVLTNVCHLIKSNTIIINSSKGLEPATGDTYFNLIRKFLPNNPICAISGPSFAIDVLKKHKTMINVICQDQSVALTVSKIFNNAFFITVPCDDEIGSSYASSLKNGLSIICGMLNALGVSINTFAGVFAQGVKEIKDIILLKKGKVETILQPCGIGDIFLTCTDSKSRNFQFGQLIANQGLTKDFDFMNLTVEGYHTINAIYPIVKKEPKHFVLFNLMYELINCQLKCEDFIDQLWLRLH